MSPFLKGALGFIGCAGICTAAYQIGKFIGREETLKEVEQEERYISATQQVVVREVPVVAPQPEQKDIVTVESSEETEVIPVQQPQTAVERVRKMHGFKNTIFGGTSVIKDLLKNPDGKKLVLTVEDGDVVARISQKEGG